MKKYGIIFDLDGTLWDAVEPITQSWNQLAQKDGRVHTRITNEQMKNMMGKTMDRFTVLFPELSQKDALELLDQCCTYELEYLTTYPGSLYPRMAETLQLLKTQYDLFIVSNCQTGYIETFLQACHMERFFTDQENYGRTGRQKADNIGILMKRNHLENGIYIGDTLGDYEAACKAKVPFVHAAYGFGKVPDAKYRVQQFAGIPQVLMEVISSCEKREKEV